MTNEELHDKVLEFTWVEVDDYHVKLDTDWMSWEQWDLLVKYVNSKRNKPKKHKGPKAGEPGLGHP